MTVDPNITDPAESTSAAQETSAPDATGHRVGVAVVGLGGAVASTMVAGVELLRLGAVGSAGLPFADRTELTPYESLRFGGWDLDPADLAKAAQVHQVLEPAQLDLVAGHLETLTPWPAVADPRWCRNAGGANVVEISSLRERIARIRDDLQRFRTEQELDTVVVLNLASTEAVPPDTTFLADAAALERAIDADDPAVTPGVLYAYAAISETCPYVNFTPGAGAESPALQHLAEQHGVPIAGRDGKTGQTMLKTVLAPALRSRGLHVDGWYSTNLLGNRDGEILNDPDSMASKVNTKGSVLDSMLGYAVDDHIVRIDYYRPRGDAKESWDNIDLTGFLGGRMQLKLDFLCRDSVLAAPLVLELVRMVVEAHRRGESGAQEQLGYFFKSPVTRDSRPPEHGFARQEQTLNDWLDGR
ncbi:inositol-3-phosphate synthase [Pseudonocardia sediminis]|uniref:inositol-3-phosphate synthase n=1 Tax=Pseudonocardia sediminis TaxID=1397368 RepID=UPI001F5FA0F2|nr:inositol-3-phosphate synthase [Pseudonocardia sediminis]